MKLSKVLKMYYKLKSSAFDRQNQGVSTGKM